MGVAAGLAAVVLGAGRTMPGEEQAPALRDKGLAGEAHNTLLEVVGVVAAVAALVALVVVPTLVRQALEAPGFFLQ